MATYLDVDRKDLKIRELCLDHLLNVSVKPFSHITPFDSFEQGSGSFKQGSDSRVEGNVMTHHGHSCTCTQAWEHSPCDSHGQPDLCHTPIFKSCCSINFENCLSAFQHLMESHDKPTISPKTLESESVSTFWPKGGSAYGDKVMVPFANTNIYCTKTQFYINDISDLQSMNPPTSPLNVNQNNDTTGDDEGIKLMINTFSTRILSISGTVREALQTTQARTPELYLLPKIHKQVTPTPGRP